MKGKRLFLLLIAAVLVGGLAAGCKPRNRDGIYDIDFYFPINSAQTPMDLALVQDKVNEIAVEKIGARVVLHAIPIGNYESKISPIIGSGDKYDLCWSSTWMNNYYQNVALGAFAPMQDLLQEYAPTVWGQIPEKAWEAARVKGDIYGALGLQILPRAPGWAVDKEMMELYMQENQLTEADLTAEFSEYGSITKFLDFVAEKNPNAGEMMIDQFMTANFQVFAGFDDIGGNTVPGVVRIDDDPDVLNEDGNYVTVFNQFASPEYRAAVREIMGWKKKGYIRESPLLETYDMTKMYANTYATYKPGVYAEQIKLVRSNSNPEKDIICFPAGDFAYYNSYLVGNMICLSYTSENPEKSVQFLELMSTDKDVYNLLVFGVEGVHYNMVSHDSNRITLTDDSVRYNLQTDGWIFGNQFNSYLTENLEDGVWEETKRINDETEIYSPIVGFSFDMSKVRVEIASCKKVFTDYDAMLMSGYWGDSSLSKLDEFNVKLRAAGIDRIIAEKQRQVNEWLASQKN